METEEQLAIDWLQQRFTFDNAARNPGLLKQTLQLLSNNPNASIADLGAGTGNNTLFLAPRLPKSCLITVVEQHDYLLQACQRRWTQALANHPMPKTTFVHQDLHQWLASAQSVDLVCNSALLDLLTENELETLLRRLLEMDTPMYSTLTYTGVKFEPAAEADSRYIQLFEAHMSRQLDRGQPLGALTMEHLASLCSELGLQLHSAPSDWQVNSSDVSFLQMNLAFYRRGIEPQLSGPNQQQALLDWLADKQAQLETGELVLNVMHQDVLVVP